MVSCGKFWGPEMLYTGSYRRALDDKLRLPLPRQLREGSAADARFYLTPGIDGCLAVYPEPAFAAIAERLAASSPGVREIREYSRLFFSQATCVVPDGQWRLRVTPELASWSHVAGEVMIVGVRDHLEIWAVDRWDQFVSRCDPHYDQLAEAALLGPMPPFAKRETQPVPRDQAEPDVLAVTTPTQPR
jgi:MraZ protein